MQVSLLMMIFTIIYIKFSITFTTYVFLHSLTSNLYQYNITKKFSFFCYIFTFVILIDLLISPLFGNSSLLLNLLYLIVNFIPRTSNRIYIVCRHAAESNNWIAFFFLIKTFNRYKAFNLSVYDYVFTIELEFFNVLIARWQTYQRVHVRNQFKFCKN